MSTSTETPYDGPIAKVGPSAHNGTNNATSEVADAPGGSEAEIQSIEEFVRFLQHAKQLERNGDGPGTLRSWLDLAEAWRITQALRSCKGNRSAAARMLGIGRRTLYSKMEKLEITPTWSI